MALAIARDAGLQPAPDQGGINLILEVAYTGPDTEVPAGSDVQPVPVLLTLSDTVAQVKAKMTNAILEDAASRNYPIVQNEVIMPSFVKG